MAPAWEEDPPHRPLLRIEIIGRSIEEFLPEADEDLKDLLNIGEFGPTARARIDVPVLRNEQVNIQGLSHID
ncbi:MAG: hypothetical protein HY726_02305 [Candidatus Rokubacteria bacterium]|nr:hypothetical protein [Candidatus Rokubacteria bacterium]